MAKGASVWAVKYTIDCTGNFYESNVVATFNWLISNAPLGTIVNWSGGFSSFVTPCAPLIVNAVEAAVKSAFDAGIIIVVAAGNDGCNASNFTPTRMSETFAVGGTSNLRFGFNQDAKWSMSRYGSSIAAFAPAYQVTSLSSNGGTAVGDGTSFSAPLISGVFAVACEAIATYATNCNNTTDTAAKYNAIKSTALMGTAVNPDGSVFSDGSPSSFVV